MDLSQRQRKLLKAIITEFMESAHAVGSLTLADKYDLGVSPATLRSEMSRLVDQGYLLKEHASAGRIPSTLGIRYYIDTMMHEHHLDKIRKTRLKERIFQKRFDQGHFIREAVKALADLSDLAAISVVNNTLFVSGLYQLLASPEFENLELLRDTLSIVESDSILETLFRKFSRNHDIIVLVGDEIGITSLCNCSIVFSPFNYFRGRKGYLAALGPKRMQYSQVLPAVRTISRFMDESIRGWE